MDPEEFIDDDELFGQGKMCYTCHKLIIMTTIIYIYHD